MSTLLWDAQAALKTALTAAVSVPVYDSGDLVGDDARAFVVIGDPSDEGDTATADQELSDLGGNRWRVESGDVGCFIEVWDGGTNIAPLRTEAKALLTACMDAVKSDPTLGGLLTLPGFAQVSSVRLREGQTDRGVLVRVGFTVGYSALLT